MRALCIFFCVCLLGGVATALPRLRRNRHQMVRAAAAAAEEAEAVVLVDAEAGVRDLPSVVCGGTANLSPIRKQMFEWLDKYIPSKQGVHKTPPAVNLFDGYTGLTQAQCDAKHKAHEPIVTTCGMFPGALLKRLGIDKGMFGASMTEGLRLCAQALGGNVYVQPDVVKRPKPGDLYWLRYANAPGRDAVSHVGVICNAPATGDWKTLDAGQGSCWAQEANLVTRASAINTNVNRPMIAGPGYVGDPAAMRAVGGWIDLDALFEPATLERAKKVKINKQNRCVIG